MGFTALEKEAEKYNIAPDVLNKIETKAELVDYIAQAISNLLSERHETILCDRDALEASLQPLSLGALERNAEERGILPETLADINSKQELIDVIVQAAIRENAQSASCRRDDLEAEYFQMTFAQLEAKAEEYGIPLDALKTVTSKQDLVAMLLEFAETQTPGTSIASQSTAVEPPIQANRRDAETAAEKRSRSRSLRGRTTLESFQPKAKPPEESGPFRRKSMRNPPRDPPRPIGASFAAPSAGNQRQKDNATSIVPSTNVRPFTQAHAIGARSQRNVFGQIRAPGAAEAWNPRRESMPPDNDVVELEAVQIGSKSTTGTYTLDFKVLSSTRYQRHPPPGKSEPMIVFGCKWHEASRTLQTIVLKVWTAASDTVAKFAKGNVVRVAIPRKRRLLTVPIHRTLPVSFELDEEDKAAMRLQYELSFAEDDCGVWELHPNTRQIHAFPTPPPVTDTPYRSIPATIAGSVILNIVGTLQSYDPEETKNDTRRTYHLVGEDAQEFEIMVWRQEALDPMVVPGGKYVFRYVEATRSRWHKKSQKRIPTNLQLNLWLYGSIEPFARE